MAPTGIKPHGELHELLPFVRLLTEISTFFINLPAKEIDNEIVSVQSRICKLLDLDRSSLWLASENDPGLLLLAHLHQPLESLTPPERLSANDFWPWTAKKILGGETVAISKMSELPAEAVRDRESFRLYGTRSTVLVPLSVGSGNVFGALSFAVTREERDWPEMVVQQFQLVAQIFANALSRKRMEVLLRQSEERLSLAASSAEAGLWVMNLDADFVWATDKLRELFCFTPNEELSAEQIMERIHPDDRDSVRGFARQSLTAQTMIRAEFRILCPDGGIRWILSRGRPHLKPSGEPDLIMGASLDITERKEMEALLQEHLEEIERLKLQLEKENLYLREELRDEMGFEKIIGSSDELKYVLFRVRQAAPTDATVLILGETGTGKGMVAHAIHSLSGRKDRPMVTVNCAALPANLIESELFGREKGAFTGAYARQAGRFEVADKGTIFLDEIGELPLELQSKLLRVLQDGEFELLGSAKTVKVDVRVIASTSRDLREEVRAGRFREDLFYRLNVFPVSIPPLRKRAGDIPQLVRHFVDKYTRKSGKKIETVPKATVKALQKYSWPGNVRELEHTIERAVIITEGPVLHISDHFKVLKPPDSTESSPKDMAAVEREHILRVLHETNWIVGGPRGAASILNIHPSTLRFRIKKLGIQRP